MQLPLCFLRKYNFSIFPLSCCFSFFLDHDRFDLRRIASQFWGCSLCCKQFSLEFEIIALFLSINFLSYEMDWISCLFPGFVDDNCCVSLCCVKFLWNQAMARCREQNITWQSSEEELRTGLLLAPFIIFCFFYDLLDAVNLWHKIIF